MQEQQKVVAQWQKCRRIPKEDGFVGTETDKNKESHLKSNNNPEDKSGAGKVRM